jgi:hypothetical protein
MFRVKIVIPSILFDQIEIDGVAEMEERNRCWECSALDVDQMGLTEADCGRHILKVDKELRRLRDLKKAT